MDSQRVALIYGKNIRKIFVWTLNTNMYLQKYPQSNEQAVEFAINKGLKDLSSKIKAIGGRELSDYGQRKIIMKAIKL